MDLPRLGGGTLRRMLTFFKFCFSTSFHSLLFCSSFRCPPWWLNNQILDKAFPLTLRFLSEAESAEGREVHVFHFSLLSPLFLLPVSWELC